MTDVQTHEPALQTHEPEWFADRMALAVAMKAASCLDSFDGLSPAALIERVHVHDDPSLAMLDFLSGAKGAPGEALYIHLGARGHHGEPVDGWATRPPIQRAEYETVMRVFEAVRPIILAELAPKPVPLAAPPAPPVAIEDTIFEQHVGLGDVERERAEALALRPADPMPIEPAQAPEVMVVSIGHGDGVETTIDPENETAEPAEAVSPEAETADQTSPAGPETHVSAPAPQAEASDEPAEDTSAAATPAPARRSRRS